MRLSLAQVTGWRGHGLGILGTNLDFRERLRPLLAAGVDDCTHLAHGNEDEDRDAHQWNEDEKTAHHARPGAGKIPIHHHGVALLQAIQHG